MITHFVTFTTRYSMGTCGIVWSAILILIAVIGAILVVPTFVLAPIVAPILVLWGPFVEAYKDIKAGRTLPVWGMFRFNWYIARAVLQLVDWLLIWGLVAITFSLPTMGIALVIGLGGFILQLILYSTALDKTRNYYDRQGAFD